MRPVPSGDLLDRAAELAALDDAVEALGSNVPSVIEIAGTSGTGRSALLAHAIRRARRRGLVVAVTDVPAAEEGAPPIAATVLRRLSRLGQANAVGSPHVSGTAAAALLRLARTAPVLLAVDDADRLDELSRDWLAQLARRVDGRAIAIIVVTDAVRCLLNPALVLRTRPLPPRIVTNLVTARFGNRVDAGAVARLTGGVPAVLRAVLDGLSDDAGELEELAAEAHGDLAVRTAAALPSEVTRLLQVIALCGPWFDVDLMCELAGLSDVPPSCALDLLTGAGLITVEPLRLAAGIEDWRLLARMPRQDRDDLHVRAACLGYRAAVSESGLARVLATAPPLGEPWVVPVLRGAARRAVEKNLPPVAAQHLERALREPVTPDVRAELVLELAVVESRFAPEAGDRRLARMLLETQPPECAHVRLAAADQLFARGDTALVRRTFGAVRSSGVERDCLAAMYGLVDDAPFEAGQLDVPPLPAAPLDPQRAGPAAWLRVMRGDDAALARRLARTALTAPAAALIPRLYACMALAYTDDVDEAVAGADAVLADARRLGLTAVVSQALVVRALAITMAGRPREAAIDLSAALSELAPAHWHADLRPMLVAFEILISVECGQAGRVAELPAVPADALGSGHARTLMLFAQAGLALTRGETDVALAHAEECGRWMAARRWLNPAPLPWRSMIATVLHARGDTERAVRLCTEEVDHARAWGVPGALGRAHLRRAAVSGDRDDLREAVRLLRKSPSRLARATALLDLAEFEEARAAAPLVREAADIAVRNRADHLIDRARRLGWVPGGPREGA